MGKNAKLNRELAKLGMALSREDLYYYICYKVEKYLTYKKGMILLNRNLSSLNTPPNNTEDLKIKDIELFREVPDPFPHAIELFFTPYIKTIDFFKKCITFCFYLFRHGE